MNRNGKRLLSLFVSLLMLFSVIQPGLILANAQSAVSLEMRDSVVKGSGDSVECTVADVTDPVFTWTSDDTDVVEVTGYGATAAVKYKSEGTATVTVSVTGAEGTFTDSAEVTVTGDYHNIWDEDIYHPAVQWMHYELVDAPQVGKNYVITGSNTAGSGNAFYGEINNDMLKTSSVTVNAGDDTSDNRPYIDSPQTRNIWTVSNSANAMILSVNNGKELQKLKTQIEIKGSGQVKTKKLQLNKDGNDTSVQWTYSDNHLMSLNNTAFGLQLNGDKYQLNNSGYSSVYFYEETQHETAAWTETVTHDDIVEAEYAPSSSLKYQNEDADGKRYDIYNVPVGTEIKLDGSYTGYAANGALANAVWSSSAPDVATVQNGVVTVTGTGLAEITYTVTDGTTSLVKKVILNVSQKDRPFETFVLTDTLTAGKQYAIASSKAAGSGAAMTADLMYFSTGYNRIVHCADGVEIEADGSETSFMSDNEKIILTAETDGQGHIYLKDYYGKYLWTDEYCPEGSSSYELDLMSADTKEGSSRVSYDGDGKVYVSTYGTNWIDGVRLFYNNSTDCFYPEWDDSERAAYKVYLYEKVETNPLAKVKYQGKSVGGTGMTIYSVSDASSLNLTGEYRNFPGDVNIEWISSDESIATVDQNGFVQFTGEEGDVVITYKVTDKEDNTVKASASVTYTATHAKDPKRVFKPATTIEAGKKYIVVSTHSIGAAYVMNHDTSANSSHFLAGDYHVIQIDSADGSLYVELEEDELRNIWTAAASSTAGSHYFINDENGEYLYVTNSATNSGYLDTGALNTRNNTQYSWKMSGSGLVSASGNYILWSDSSSYFRPQYEGESSSNVYLFEEVELVPVVKIRSGYVAIDGKTVSRSQVCAYQTETLVGAFANFNTSRVNLVWSSDNDEVATVDPATGVLTYTGKSGTVNVTVNAVSTVPNEDGSYDTATAGTTIKVIGTEIGEESVTRYMLTDEFVPGEVYAISTFDTAGVHNVMNTWAGEYDSDGNEYISWSTSVEFIKNATTTYFDSEDQAIAWTCESTGDGYYYLRNYWGAYLLLYEGTSSIVDYTNVIGGEGGNSRVRYDASAYKFNQYDNELNRVSTVQSRSRGNYLSEGNYGKFRLSSEPRPIYIYRQCEPGEATRPAAQIRHDAFGGNEDISNSLLTRNEVADGDTERLLCFHEGFDSIGQIVWSSSDPSIATIDENGLITYTGKEGIVTFTMEVQGTKDENPVSIKQMVSMCVSPDPYEPPTEDYPEFPHEGSVRINKTATGNAGGTNFQTSGVAEVELAVTGVPMSKPVDVVIVFDHSSSMNAGSRLVNAINDTRDFALHVVTANEKNRVAIVTFDRYVNQYEVYNSQEADYTSHPSATENRIITGDGTYEGAFVGIEDAETLVTQIDSLIYNDIEGTNYDEGLEKAYKIVEAAKKDPNANDEQYVIFMSDGEPYAYNKVGITYPKNNVGDKNYDRDLDYLYVAWLQGDETNKYISTMLTNPGSYPVSQYYHPDGKHWIAEAIKTPEGEDAGLPSASYYNPYRTGLGTEIYTIGYSPDAQGALTTETLEKIATTPDNMYFAEDNLQVVYDQILQSIIYAANEAVVTDKMGEYYNLQIATTYSTGNEMSTITLDPEPYIEIGSWKLNSDSTRSQEYTELEKITFETNMNGVLTGAVSDQVDGSVYDAAKNKIVGKYITYDFNTEEFSWNVGNISRDEITLKYYAYLEGSIEGEREADLYDTNEHAQLDYNNYLEHPCNQVFPVPTLGWEQAAVSYEFYLVNEYGQPVNSEGMVVPFSERVLVGNPQTEIVNLNSSDEEIANVVAKNVVPEGYALFNEDASYRVDISSGDNESQATIDDKDDIVTTTYYDGSYTFCEDGVVKGVNDYTYTHVAFAVVLKLSIVPDTVVIDYGIPVKIHVLENDILCNSEGTVTAITDEIESGTVLNTGVHDTSRIKGKTVTEGDELKLSHGNAYLENNVIVYKPSDMQMDAEEKFYYELTTKDGLKLYSTVTVIPAANIYYEDSFLTFTDNGDYKWQTAGSTYTDVFQAEDRPGSFSFANLDANNAYGRDQAYDDNSTTYSLGSAKYVELDAASVGSEPTAEFTFCGTGFDFFSCTNSDTGAVLVEVKKGNTSVSKKIVNTYYGYTYGRVYLNDAEEVTADDSGTPLYFAPEVTPDVHKIGDKLCWTTPTYYEEDGVTLTSENTGSPAYATGWVVTEGENGLYQVPVIRIRGLAYDTYDVTITPRYAKMFDMKYVEGSDSNSYKIYVDAIRIYDPAGPAPETDSVVGKAYIADDEYIPQYIELRKQMIDAETFYDSTKLLGDNELTAGVVFIDGITELNNENIGDVKISNSYLKAGPNNELYLAKGQAIAFHLVSSGKIQPESLQLGMKTVAGGVTELICTNASKEGGSTVRVAGGSEQYRKLSSFVVWDKDALAEGVYQTKYPIIIANNTDTVVSLTSIKWTYSQADAEEDDGDMLMMAVAPSTPKMAAKALQAAFATEKEQVEINMDNVSVSWKDGTIEEGGTAVLQVVTPMDITEVTVGGISLTECTPDGNGSKVWTYEFSIETAGELTYSVILRDNTGTESDVIITETITVEELPTEPSTEPSTEPGTEPSTEPGTEPSTEPGTEEGSQPSGEEEEDKGFLSFFRRFIEKIKAFFSRIIGWWK